MKARLTVEWELMPSGMKITQNEVWLAEANETLAESIEQWVRDGMVQ